MTQPSDRGQHCPFLNRTDSRCGSHFTLERLEHAFAYCFDRYTACPVYLELLVERRVRRGEACEGVCSTEEAGEPVQNEASHDAKPLVQLTIHAKRALKTRAPAAIPGAVAPKRAA